MRTLLSTLLDDHMVEHAFVMESKMFRISVVTFDHNRNRNRMRRKQTDVDAQKEFWLTPNNCNQWEIVCLCLFVFEWKYLYAFGEEDREGHNFSISANTYHLTLYYVHMCTGFAHIHIAQTYRTRFIVDGFFLTVYGGLAQFILTFWHLLA